MDGDPFNASRRWLVFFRERERYWWFDRLLAPGFRHVSAAAWFDRAGCWLFIDPTMKGTKIFVLPDGPEAHALFGQWAMQSSSVMAVISKQSRKAVPPIFGCVAAIKALLGVRTWACTPKGLHRMLLRSGAGDAVQVSRPDN